MDTIPLDIYPGIIEFLPDCRALACVSSTWYAAYRTTPDYKLWTARPLFRPKYVMRKNIDLFDFAPIDYARMGNFAAATAREYIPEDLLEEVFISGNFIFINNLLELHKDKKSSLLYYCYWLGFYVDDELGSFIILAHYDSPEVRPDISNVLCKPIPRIITFLSDEGHFAQISFITERTREIHPANVGPLLRIRDKLTTAACERIQNLPLFVDIAAADLSIENLSCLRDAGVIISPDPVAFIRKNRTIGGEIMTICIIMYVRKYGVITPELVARLRQKGFSRTFVAKIAASIRDFYHTRYKNRPTHPRCKL